MKSLVYIFFISLIGTSVIRAYTLTRSKRFNDFENADNNQTIIKPTINLTENYLNLITPDFIGKQNNELNSTTTYNLEEKNGTDASEKNESNFKISLEIIEVIPDERVSPSLEFNSNNEKDAEADLEIYPVDNKSKKTLTDYDYDYNAITSRQNLYLHRSKFSNPFEAMKMLFKLGIESMKDMERSYPDMRNFEQNYGGFYCPIHYPVSRLSIPNTKMDKTKCICGKIYSK